MPENLKAMLGRKIAGIPVIWFVLVLAVVMIYAAFRLKPAPEEEVPADDLEEEPDGDMNTDQPVFRVAPVIPQPTQPGIIGVPEESTNELWARRAVEWLIANGETYSAASTAITVFLSGETLSSEQGRIRDRAIKQFGIPPEGIVSSPTLPQPKPSGRQGNPPVDHVVKGSGDNTFAEIARIYYGSGIPDNRNLVAAGQGNHNKKEPFAVGTRIHVPAKRAARFYTATSATRTAEAIATKNGVRGPGTIRALNPGMKFPVAVGKRVRVA